MNERGQYGGNGVRAWSGAARVGAAAPDGRRVGVTNIVLIGVGVVLGGLGWREYKREKPLGVIALGASGSLVASGLSGLLLGREGGGDGT